MKRVCYLCFAVFLLILNNTNAQKPEVTLFSEYGWKKYSSYRSGAQAKGAYGSGGFFMEYSQKDGDIFVRNWYLDTAFAVDGVSKLEFPFVVRVKAGTLLLGGIFSRLNKPLNTVPQAFKTMGRPQTTVIATVPSFSSGTGKFLSLHSLFSIGPFSFTLTGRIPRLSGAFPFLSNNYTFFTSAQYSFPFLPENRPHAQALRGSVTLVAGRTLLRSKLSNDWYLNEAFYAPSLSRFAAVEGVLQNNLFSLFSSNGFSEHPDGGLRFFSRTEFLLKAAFFTFTGGITLIDAGYIPLSGSIVRQTFLSWLNPQGDFLLNADRSIRLRLGFLASLEYEQSAGAAANSFLYAGVKSLAELTFGRCKVKLSFAAKKIDVNPFLRFCPQTQFSAALLAEYRSALYRPLWKVSSNLKAEWNVPGYFNSPQPDDSIKNKIVPSVRAVITPYTSLKFQFDVAVTLKNNRPFSVDVGADASYEIYFLGQRLETLVSVEFEKKLSAGNLPVFSGKCSARLRP